VENYITSPITRENITGHANCYTSRFWRFTLFATNPRLVGHTVLIPSHDYFRKRQLFVTIGEKEKNIADQSFALMISPFRGDSHTKRSKSGRFIINVFNKCFNKTVCIIINVSHSSNLIHFMTL